MWGDLNVDQKPVVSDYRDSFLAAVHQSLRQSVEEMIFMPVNKSAMLVALLPLLEPVEGKIQLVMPDMLARDITLSIYACEADKLTTQMVEDAVAELINTVAGQLVASVLSEDQTFTLGLPVVSRDSCLTYDATTRSAFLSIGTGTIEVNISGASLLSLFREG